MQVMIIAIRKFVNFINLVFLISNKLTYLTFSFKLCSLLDLVVDMIVFFVIFLQSGLLKTTFYALSVQLFMVLNIMDFVSTFVRLKIRMQFLQSLSSPCKLLAVLFYPQCC